MHISITHKTPYRNNEVKQACNLIPIFNQPIQPTRNNLASFLGMPIQTSSRATFLPTSQDLMVHFSCFPIPEADIAATITGSNELSIWGDLDINGVAGIVVATETLLPVLAEFVRGAVHDDLVIAGLEGDVFAVGVGGGAGEGEHVWFGDEFDGYGDAVFPGAEGFVVGGGDEAAVVVDKGDGVDGCQVVVVFLDQFAGAGVELHDLLVGHTGQELVRVFGAGVEADDMGGLACAETSETFAVFGVPELDLAVVGGCEEGGAAGVEVGVRDGLGVAGEGAQQFA